MAERALWVVLTSTLFGCTDWLGPAEITTFEVTTQECGGWTAEIRARNLRGQDVVLLRDGEPVRTFSGGWGEEVLFVDGGEPLTGTTRFDVRIDRTEAHAQQVTTPPRPTMTAELRPGPMAFALGTPPRFDLWVHTSCEVPGLEWRGSTGSWTGSGPIVGSVTSVVLAEHAEGPQVLRLDVVDADGPLATAETMFAVGAIEALDVDGDGHLGWSDCNDRDATVGPDLPEASTPNGVDDNCDGRIDEGTVVYDDDGDGLSEEAGDCNDRDPLILPGAPERPNCRDDDCDQAVDDGTTLPHDDDPWEQRDGLAYRWERIGRQRELVQAVRIVSRDRSDLEAFQFWSDDGGWDSWGIDVVAEKIPANSVYHVEIRPVGGTAVATGELTADGDVVTETGKAFNNESGFYEVLVRPVSLYAEWCPAEITVVSR